MSRYKSTPGKVILYTIVLGSILLSLGYPNDMSKALQREDHGILVRFHNAEQSANVRNMFLRLGYKVMGYIPQIDVWLVTTDQTSSVNEALGALQQEETVAWVEVNGTVHMQEVVPNDNYYQAQQENLRVIGLATAWMVTTGGENVIAIIDTGIDLDHADLQVKIWTNTQEIPANNIDDDLNGYIDDVQGWDFVNNDNEPQDDQTHGSHVGGIAAASTNNQVGIAGVSWGAPLMALKVLNSAGDGSWADVAEAIVYAADNGARVINMSFGDEKSSQTIEMAVDYARDQGCLMVAAAGNGGLSVLYPAALEDVLAVAATNNQDLPWTFGNQGPEIGIAAPGVDVFSTNALGSYTTLSGTSMSAPHVSGVASLIWSLRPDYSAIDVTQVLTTTAVDVWSPGFDPLTGWGRVNASTAIETVSSTLAYLPLVNSVGKTDKEKIYIPLLVMDHK